MVYIPWRWIPDGGVVLKFSGIEGVALEVFCFSLHGIGLQ